MSPHARFFSPFTKKRQRAFTVIFLLTFIGTTVLFVLMSLFDNKYTQNSVKPQNGLMILEDDSLKKSPIIFLVEDWELYKGVLLNPETIHTAQPDDFINIGDYHDMSFGDTSRSPHGHATYRLLIDTSRHEGDNVYTLQLPEIYSSYRLYINGNLMLSAGIPEAENYKAKIFTSEVTFRAEDEVEIILAVSDWSHYYSGIISPPAFGDTIAINTMVQSNLVRCSIMMGIAITLGLIVHLVGVMLERKPGVLFLLLALTFCGYTAYTIIHALFPAGIFWHYFETFCYYAMFFLCIWLIGIICHIHTKISLIVKIMDAAMCVLSIAVPLFFSGYHAPMYIFHQVTLYYKYFLLIYLLVVVTSAMLNDAKYAPVVLCGLSTFLSATIVSIIMPKHDPITLGTSLEVGCFIMLCYIGWAMVYSCISRHRHTQYWHHGHYDERHLPPLPDTQDIEETLEPELEAPI